MCGEREGLCVAAIAATARRRRVSITDDDRRAPTAPMNARSTAAISIARA
jgi:hypothetical protein